jgi:hypothetical protein
VCNTVAWHADLTQGVGALSQNECSKRSSSHTRPSWWIWGQNLEQTFATHEQAETEIARRQNMMLRRSTLEYYYSAAQVAQLVNVVPVGSTKSGWHRVETCVILFSRIGDLENCSMDTLLNFSTYDNDGNHLVSLEELDNQRTDP